MSAAPSHAISENDLLRRLLELDRKVAALEGRRLRFPGWLAILACGFLGGALGRFATEPQAFAQPAPQDITARSVKIVNANGREILSIEGDPDGGCIRVRGHDGTERGFFGVGSKNGGGLIYFRTSAGKGWPVNIGVDADGGYLSLRNTDDKQTLFIGNDDAQGGMLGLNDRQGFPRFQVVGNVHGGAMNIYGVTKKNTAAGPRERLVSTGVGPKGGYMIVSNNDTGKQSVSMSSDEYGTGGVVVVCDPQGAIRCDMGCNKEGGLLSLVGNSKGKRNVFLGTGGEKHGGLLLLHDDDAKVGVEAGLRKSGGYFYLNGVKDELPNVTMGTYDDQRGGYVQVLSKNKIKVELGLDRSGTGYFDTFEKQKGEK